MGRGYMSVAALAMAAMGVGFESRGRGTGRLPLPQAKGGKHFTSEKPLSKRAKRRLRGKAKP